MLSARDAVHFHSRIVSETGEELWRNQEVLTSVLFASDIDHALMNHTLVSGVHSLVDLVHNTEGGACKRLEGHEVEDGRYRPLTTRLAMFIEDLQSLAFPMNNN